MHRRLRSIALPAPDADRALGDRCIRRHNRGSASHRKGGGRTQNHAPSADLPPATAAARYQPAEIAARFRQRRLSYQAPPTQSP